MDTFMDALMKRLSLDANPSEQTGDIETTQGAVAILHVPGGSLFPTMPAHPNATPDKFPAVAEAYTGPADEEIYWRVITDEMLTSGYLSADTKLDDLPEPGWYVTYLSDTGIIEWRGPLSRDDAQNLFAQEEAAYADPMEDWEGDGEDN